MEKLKDQNNVQLGYMIQWELVACCYWINAFGRVGMTDAEVDDLYHRWRPLYSEMLHKCQDALKGQQVLPNEWMWRLGRHD